MKVNLNLAVISVLRRDKERYVRSLTEAVEDLFFFFLPMAPVGFKRP